MTVNYNFNSSIISVTLGDYYAHYHFVTITTTDQLNLFARYIALRALDLRPRLESAIF